MAEIRVRVVSQEKGFYRLSCDKGEKLGSVSGRYRHDATTVSDFPAVGDYVVAQWPDDDSNAVIQMLFPRKSCFMRKAAGLAKQEQVVAANVDTVLICVSLNNDFSLRRIERYLSATYESGATPVVVLTKRDLCEDVPARIAEVGNVAFGVDVVSVSSADGDIDAVLEYLEPGRTVAFLGSSGVGKSTLINKIIGVDAIATNGIRSDDKGRHTTTHRELIALDNGAFVIDTPGMRELGMWDTEEGIEFVFADIEELATRCRFGDCRHGSEPGCAIQEALVTGGLDPERWRSYQKLMAENAYAADGSQYLEAKRDKFKQIAKMNRAVGR